ncbi:hypothetical protein ACFLYE_01745 [Chloroflexota bacterium]
MEENFIKELMASTKCSACGQYYTAKDINVLAHEDNLWFLRASCSVCDTECLVAAVIQEDIAPEVITDLTETERDKFESADVLTADDVLNMHHFLKDFDGDFSRLFNWRKAQ